MFGVSMHGVSAKWLWHSDPSSSPLADGPQSGSDEQRSQLLPQSQRTARQHAAGRFAMSGLRLFAGFTTRVSAPGKVLSERSYRSVSRTEVL